jgi:hypothetical protein
MDTVDARRRAGAVYRLPTWTVRIVDGISISKMVVVASFMAKSFRSAVVAESPNQTFQSCLDERQSVLACVSCKLKDASPTLAVSSSLPLFTSKTRGLLVSFDWTQGRQLTY